MEANADIAAVLDAAKIPTSQNFFCDTPLIRSGEHNLKNVVIAVLSEQWPLSARKVYKEALNGKVSKVTYQGVHKALRQLREQGIVRRSEAGHQLDLDWINELESYSAFLKSNYSVGKNTDLYTLANGDSECIQFESFFDAICGLLEMMNREHERKAEPDEVLVSLAHPLPIIGVPSKTLEGLKENSKANRYCTQYSSKTKNDMTLSRAWESFGIRENAGKGENNNPAGQFNIVTKNLLIQLVTTPQFSRAANLIFRNRNPEDALPQYSRLCKDPKSRTSVAVMKNTALANQIREAFRK